MREGAGKMKTIILSAALMIAAPVMANDCSPLRAYNKKLHDTFGLASLPFAEVGLKHIPCHCILVSERVDRVYPPDERWPAGMQCGNGMFYDKHCHMGVTCYPK
jgi:hypothetical protein